MPPVIEWPSTVGGEGPAPPTLDTPPSSNTSLSACIHWQGAGCHLMYRRIRQKCEGDGLGYDRDQREFLRMTTGLRD